MKKILMLLVVFASVSLLQAQTVNPQPLVNFLNRITENNAHRFVTVVDEGLSKNGKDVFIITSADGKPCIKGNTILSVTTGVNWYLNHYAHINLTWNNLTTDLANAVLPVPENDEQRTCTADYRYNFNTCTFSYSMAFWTWERWQQEIDWMALHGINMPLNLVGLDVLWRNVLKDSRVGYSDAEVAEYVAGPGFIAWFAMNNLEGWGGSINAVDVQMNGNPDWWYERQEQLCRNMLARMRELGMQPVIPGFSGQVPNSMNDKNIDGINKADIVNNGTWAGGYTRPDILNPASESYAYLAKIYYEHLEALMGVSEFYSMDPFHEGALPAGIDVSTCYPGVISALDRYFATVSPQKKIEYDTHDRAKWVIQYWQGVPVKRAFSVMEEKYGDRFIALDLFSDAQGKAKWNTDYFAGCDFIFCMLHNFGGRSGMHGRLQTTMEDYFKALAKSSHMKGVGATPEGIETNPILYDMLFELPWMDADNPPTINEWLSEYSLSRYGVKNEVAVNALTRLKNSVWGCKTDQQGTSEAVILARPSWNVRSVSSWSTSAIYWDRQEVLLAADELISIADLITTDDGKNNYSYDVIDVVRQSMVDYAAVLLPKISAARSNRVEYERLYKLYLQLMLDLDAMLSYDQSFKLERWTSLARNIADEVSATTVNDRNWLEWNARTQITVWSKYDTDLHDYSNRCWAGLIKDYHYKRWKHFFENDGKAPVAGWFATYERPWTIDFTNYDYSSVNVPTDILPYEKAKETFTRYFGRLRAANGSYIFPMGIENDATDAGVQLEAYRGRKYTLPIELNDDVSVKTLWIDFNIDFAQSENEVVELKDNAIVIPKDALIGRTKAIARLSDGTSITFNIAIRENITKKRKVTVKTAANGTVAIEGSDKLSLRTKEPVTMIATADNGYNFYRWVDADGVIVTNDNPYTYYAKDNARFTAEFTQNKWGVPSEDKTDWGDVVTYGQYVRELTMAFNNREAETIYKATECPQTLFNIVPQIINVSRGAGIDIGWSDGSDSDVLKYCYLSAYVDLNSDGDFDDAGELVKIAGKHNAADNSASGGKFNVLIPYDAPLGITHLRVRFDGAWKTNYNKDNDAFPAKAPLNRMCYEVLLNVTEYSSLASNIIVKTSDSSLGTAAVSTDETPDGSTAMQWEVSRGIKFTLTATVAAADVEFAGWYDQYGRLVSTEPVCTMYASGDALYTARFRTKRASGN